MGMFDYVYYEGEEYQTKSFDCLMDSYFITRKKLYRKPSWLCRKRKKYRVLFHGVFNFYDLQDDYLAKFTDGVLVNIKKLPD